MLMITKAFSKRSKSFLSRSIQRTLSILFLSGSLLGLFSGCSVSPPPPQQLPEKTEVPSVQQPVEQVKRIEIVVPPWRLYSETNTLDASIKQLDNLLGENDLHGALILGEKLRSESPENVELLTRVSSLKLQYGHSKEVLSEISRYAASVNKTPEQLPPALTLIIAYSYKHLHDIDQTIAWLGVTLKGSQNTQPGALAKREIDNLLSRINDSGLLEYSKKWDEDPVIASLFLAERERRARGGKVVSGGETDFFSPSTYGVLPFASKQTASSVSPLVIVTATEGKGGKLGERFRRGIDCAREATDPEFLLIEEELALERLHSVSGIKAIIGPQYSKTFSELIAAVPGDVLFFPITKQVKKGERVFPLTISPEIEVMNLHGFARDVLQKEDAVILVSGALDEARVKELGAPYYRVTGLETSLPPELQGKSTIISLLAIDNHIEFFALLKRADPAITFIGGRSSLDLVTLRGFIDLFEGMYLLTPFYPESERPVVSRFIAAYREKFQETPTVEDAIAFDMGRILISRIRNQGENLLQGLRDLGDFQSVTGITSFSSDGEIVRKFQVLEVRGGEIVERGRELFGPVPR